MPSYRRLNPDELPAEYADGTYMGDHKHVHMITMIICRYIHKDFGWTGFVVDALVVEVPQLLAQLVQGLRDDGGTPPPLR